MSAHHTASEEEAQGRTELSLHLDSRGSDHNVVPAYRETNLQAPQAEESHLALLEDCGYFLSRRDTARGDSMRGIDFVTNKSGKKTAVLIDLKRHGQLWEDFYDSVVAGNRTRETRESLDMVKDRLRRLGKLRG